MVEIITFLTSYRKVEHVAMLLKFKKSFFFSFHLIVYGEAVLSVVVSNFINLRMAN